MEPRGVDPDWLDGFRRETLEYARQVKADRRRLMMNMRAGRVDVLDLLMDPPDCIHTMEIWDLMMEMPAHFRTRVHQAVDGTGVGFRRGRSPFACTMGEFHRWERAALVAYIQDNW